MTDPAERLLGLAELEHRLVAEGRFDELAAVHDERDHLVASLPRGWRPDGRQASLVAHAQLLLAQATALALAARTELAAELARLDRGRATVRGYVPAGLAGGPTVDRVG